jgi:hypothetical protein
MSWFGLGPQDILDRAKASGAAVKVPTLASSLLRGVVGFTIVSVAGFCPWALGAKWFHGRAGEIGMYAACALTFIGLSGVLLHGLIIGPGSLPRFYKLFGVAFAAYSAAWIAGWMGLHGHAGSLAGLFAGTALMGWILACAFDERGAALKSIAALFVLNTLGYYAGGWAEGKVAHLPHLSLAGLVLEKPPPITVAMLLWGVGYGIGLGAGLGLAFYFCQKTVRERLSTASDSRQG